jgi:hypothetical protein
VCARAALLMLLRSTSIELSVEQIHASPLFYIFRGRIDDEACHHSSLISSFNISYAIVSLRYMLESTQQIPVMSDRSTVFKRRRDILGSKKGSQSRKFKPSEDAM